mmetsp:Transcript_64767/g.173744  ORF Transcript_64767/g.173744 Transcript_64767/m.173744 type:complete len:227 (-) Transcript_64767:1001-1681(-)
MARFVSIPQLIGFEQSFELPSLNFGNDIIKSLWRGRLCIICRAKPVVQVADPHNMIAVCKNVPATKSNSLDDLQIIFIPPMKLPLVRCQVRIHKSNVVAPVLATDCHAALIRHDVANTSCLLARLNRVPQPSTNPHSGPNQGTNLAQRVMNYWAIYSRRKRARDCFPQRSHKVRFPITTRNFIARFLDANKYDVGEQVVRWLRSRVTGGTIAQRTGVCTTRPLEPA